MAARSLGAHALGELRARASRGFVTSPPDRPSTLARRLDAFESLQARANLYRDVLQVHVQDLNKTIAGLTASVEGTAEPEGDSVASRHASTGACSAAALCSTLNHALKLGGAPPSFPKRTLAPTSLPCGGLPSPVPRRLAGGR